VKKSRNRYISIFYSHTPQEPPSLLQYLHLEQSVQISQSLSPEHASYLEEHEVLVTKKNAKKIDDSNSFFMVTLLVDNLFYLLLMIVCFISIRYCTRHPNLTNKCCCI
jgi:hypothetical protein